MTYDDFTALKVRIDQQIAWVTLDHPPINLLDLAAHPRARPARPCARPTTRRPRRRARLRRSRVLRRARRRHPDPGAPHRRHVAAHRARAVPRHGRPVPHHAQGHDRDHRRHLPRRRRASSPCRSTCASPRSAGPCSPNPKCRVGIIPGGGGTQRLPASSAAAARSKSCSAAPTSTPPPPSNGATSTERYPTASSARSSRHSPPASPPSPPRPIARAKAAVDAALPDPISGLLIEAQQFRASLSDPETHPRLEAFMERGGQTRDFEIQGFVQ